MHYTGGVLESQQRMARRKPEVLAPVGNLRGLKAAVDYGADAVYCGGKAFGMRSAPKNLSLEDFEEGARYAHARGARVYVTCNVLPRNNEVRAIQEYISQLAGTGVDALIVTDIGVLMTANYGAANALYDLGARRVVLAREMDLQAVRDIRANIPDDMDVECFVHGSMCMAFSGRCLISNYLTGRDGNHGECAQPCRWKYSLVEEKRPGQYFPVEETKEGTYLFNSQDMCMMEHLDDLIDSGATSLKIEGRAKSAYYIAAMTNAYKTAVNEYMVPISRTTSWNRPTSPSPASPATTASWKSARAPPPQTVSPILNNRPAARAANRTRATSPRSTRTAGSMRPSRPRRPSHCPNG